MTESQVMLENVLQSLAAGLLVGAIYGLMCVGLAMIFGIMRVINFAQGDFMMLGMYVAFYIFVGLGMQATFGGYIGPYVSVLLAAPVLFLVGYVIHELLISRVSGIRSALLVGEGHYAQLVLTLGIALILQNGGMILFGSQLVSIRTPLSSTAWELGPFWGDVVTVFVNKGRGMAALFSIAIILALWLVISRSWIGLSSGCFPSMTNSASRWHRQSLDHRGRWILFLQLNHVGLEPPYLVPRLTGQQHSR
jgi:branched-chain amino acid transport system permease protein